MEAQPQIRCGESLVINGEYVNYLQVFRGA